MQQSVRGAARHVGRCGRRPDLRRSLRRLRHKKFHATELPAVKPTVAEILADPANLTYSTGLVRPRLSGLRLPARSSTPHEEVAELEALHRWSMVLHNQYPWDRTQTRLTPVGELRDDDYVVVFAPAQPRRPGLHPTRDGRRRRRSRRAAASPPPHEVAGPAPGPAVSRRCGCASASRCCPGSRRWPRSRASSCAPTTTSSATPPTAGRRCRRRRSAEKTGIESRVYTARTLEDLALQAARAALAARRHGVPRRSAPCCSAPAPAPA